jgi:hypothetical protein
MDRTYRLAPVRIDIGRAANGGDFARVMVADQFASRFGS